MDEIRFRRYAAENPEALAIVDTAGREWKRGEIAGQVDRLSHALLRKGLLSGDVLAIFAPNCAEYIVVYLAATQIGLYVVPLNWHLAPPEIQYILENSRARAVVVHERFRKVAEGILPRLGMPLTLRISIGEVRQCVGLADFIAEHGAERIEEPVQGRLLAYTSATTGKPKGVLLPLNEANRVLDMAIASRIAVGTRPSEHVLLCASMLYHGAPLEVVSIALHMGHVVILMDAMLAEVILQLIDRHKVTMAYLVPAMFTRLLHLDVTVRARYSTMSLKRVLHTGAMCPIKVKNKMIEWWGPIFWETYGAAEGAGTLVGCVDWLKHPGTVGRPIPGSQIRIIMEDGTDAPAGTVGTIYMTRYSGDRFEYLDDPEKTRACQIGNFFTVGDVGYVDTEGYLYLCDRKIDMINLGGTKVYSAELENVLALHPSIVDCAVFGIPDEVSGEAIVAMIQAAQDAPPEREFKSVILKFAGEYLSIVKLPRHITFVSKVPRSPTGKLDKGRLREDYVAMTRGFAPASLSEEQMGIDCE